MATLLLQRVYGEKPAATFQTEFMRCPVNGIIRRVTLWLESVRPTITITLLTWRVLIDGADTGILARTSAIGVPVEVSNLAIAVTLGQQIKVTLAGGSLSARIGLTAQFEIEV